MNVLSLFNGYSNGYMTLDKLRIKVDKYYSSEIDKYANQATDLMFPDTIQLGDVTKWREWNIDFSKIDLLLAGFPCQAWSIAGNQKGDSDPRGQLVHDLIDIWNEIKKVNPNLKFLFENVRMKKEFMDYIDKLFGVGHTEINSALVSAQNRKRIYWTNIPGDGDVDIFGKTAIAQPKDKHIFLKDIIDYNCQDKLSKKAMNYMESSNGKWTGANKSRLQHYAKYENDKSGCLTANQYKGVPYGVVGLKVGAFRGRNPINPSSRKAGEKLKQTSEIRKDNKSNTITTVQKDNVLIMDDMYKNREPRYYTKKSPTLRRERSGLKCNCVGEADLKGHDSIKRVYSDSGKSPALTTMGGGHREPKIATDNIHWRKLTPRECFLLQTVPEKYIEILLSSGISNSQLYKMCGNGWTIDVICHILKGLL